MELMGQRGKHGGVMIAGEAIGVGRGSAGHAGEFYLHSIRTKGMIKEFN